MDLTRAADGHLIDAETWSRAVARQLAKEDGIELDDDHWRVIEAVRDFHRDTGVVPSMRPLVRLLRERAPALASSIALLRLFPGNPATLTAKFAGLPRPDKCL